MLDARRLKASKMRIRKLTEQGGKFSYIGGKICWRFLEVKHQKVIKKNHKHNNQNLFINMHNWRGFIMTTFFKFTYTISCMFILKQFQWETIYLLTKHVSWTTIERQLQDQYQNSGCDLVTYVHKIMIEIRTLMMQNLKSNQITHSMIKFIFLRNFCGNGGIMVSWYEFNWWWNLYDASYQTYKNYIQ